MILLENKYLKVSINPLGAELHTLFNKDTKIDYLWTGDKPFWQRQAPILFPIVGKLKDNTYFNDGKMYYLPQHGFARDYKFTTIHENTIEATFLLTHSKESFSVYPFKFQLLITYKLVENSVEVSYNVLNKGHDPMPFSIGAHPAFKCPLMTNDTFSDYFIEFETSETPLQFLLDKTTGLRQIEPIPRSLNTQLPLSYKLFSNDALIFKGLTSKKIALKSTKHHHGIDFICEHWQFFAFWTQQNAPFICFEPWMGAADFITTNQHLNTKDGILILNANKSYTNNYTLLLY